MSFWRSLMTRDQLPREAALPRARHRFAAVGSDYATYMALVGNALAAGRVTRAQAIAVPAVKRSRDLIAGTLSTLPLHATNATGDRIERQLLEQPESLSGFVRCVTMARTIEDLFFEASSLWLVLTRDQQGYPTAVERVEHGKWTQDADGTIRVNGREVSTSDIVLFTSPNDPLLVAGAPAIKNLIRLEATAALYANEPEAASYFTPNDPDDDPEDEAVQGLLSDWATARKNRSTAWVPGSVRLNHVTRMNAEELQLIEAREFAVTEVARLTGIDATWLSVNTTTRTYSNVVDERRQYVDFVLAPYMHAVEERLSLGDITPRGQRVRFNVDGFLRGATKDRYEAHAIAIGSGFLTVDEVRTRFEDWPSLPESGGAPNA